MLLPEPISEPKTFALSRRRLLWFILFWGVVTLIPIAVVFALCTGLLGTFPVIVFTYPICFGIVFLYWRAAMGAVWQVTLTDSDVVLESLFYSRTIPWGQLIEVSKECNLSGLCYAISVRGNKVIAIPAGMESEEHLLETMRTHIPKPSMALHRDFGISHLALIGQRLSMFLGFGAMLIPIYAMWNLIQNGAHVEIGAVIVLILCPIVCAVPIVLAASRATHVHIYDHGLRIRTLFGVRDIYWEQISSIQRIGSGNSLLIGTESTTVTLGDDLMRFDELNALIREKFAEQSAKRLSG